MNGSTRHSDDFFFSHLIALLCGIAILGLFAKAAYAQDNHDHMLEHAENTDENSEIEAPRGRTHNQRLIIAGWSVFLNTYAAGILSRVVTLGLDSGIGFIPLVGPAVHGTMFVSGKGEDIISLCIGPWIESLVQVSGLMMAVIGHIRRSHDDNPELARRLNISVSPAMIGRAAALNVSGTF